MLEVNVNRLVTKFDPRELSGSIAERGQNAGKETWANSVKAAKKLLKNEAERQAARDWASEFGAWDEAEIKRWSNAELDALVLQYAAGDLREAQALCEGDGVADIDWNQHEKLSERGTIGGNLFEHNGQLWISLS